MPQYEQLIHVFVQHFRTLKHWRALNDGKAVTRRGSELIAQQIRINSVTSASTLVVPAVLVVVLTTHCLLVLLFAEQTQLGRYAEVAQLEHVVARDQQVAWLDVVVNDVETVQVLEAVDELTKIKARLPVAQTLIGRVLQQPFQTRHAVVHENIDLWWLL